MPLLPVILAIRRLFELYFIYLIAILISHDAPEITISVGDTVHHAETQDVFDRRGVDWKALFDWLFSWSHYMLWWLLSFSLLCEDRYWCRATKFEQEVQYAIVKVRRPLIGSRACTYHAVRADTLTFQLPLIITSSPDDRHFLPCYDSSALKALCFSLSSPTYIVSSSIEKVITYVISRYMAMILTFFHFTPLRKTIYRLYLILVIPQRVEIVSLGHHSMMI